MQYTNTHISSLETIATTAVILGAIPKSALSEMVITLKGSLTSDQAQPKEKYQSKKQVASSLGVHPLTVHRLIKSGKLEAVHIGSAVRVKQSSLDSYLAGE